MASEQTILNEIEKVLDNGFDKTKDGKEALKLLPEQLKTLRKYKEYYEAKPSSKGGKIKLVSVWNTVMALRQYGLFIKKPFEDVTVEDNIEWVKSIMNKSPATINNYKISVGSLMKWIKKSEAWDDPIFKVTRIKTTRTPKMLLSQDEIKRMLEFAPTYKMKSIVMLTFGEGGMRAGEVISCNIEDFEPDTNGAKLWVRKSKSKERYVRLVDGEPFLREYINREHRYNKDSSYPLFYSDKYGEGYGKRMQVNGINQLVKRLAKKSGIKKRIFAHLGRHTAITGLKRLGMDSSLLAKRSGITISTLERVYLHSTDKDVDDDYLRLKGKNGEEEIKKIREEQKKLEIKVCSRCQYRYPDKPELWKHPSTALYCSCGMALDPIEAERIAEQNRKNEEKLKQFIDPEQIQQLFKTLAKLRIELDELKKG